MSPLRILFVSADLPPFSRHAPGAMPSSSSARASSASRQRSSPRTRLALARAAVLLDAAHAAHVRLQPGHPQSRGAHAGAGGLDREGDRGVPAHASRLAPRSVASPRLPQHGRLEGEDAPPPAALALPAARAAPVRPSLHVESPQREGVSGARAPRGASHGARRQPDLPGARARARGRANGSRRAGRLHRPLGRGHRACAAAGRRSGARGQDLRRRLESSGSLRRARPGGPGSPGDRPRVHARDPFLRRERRDRFEVESQPHRFAHLPDPGPRRLPAARAKRGGEGAVPRGRRGRVLRLRRRAGREVPLLRGASRRATPHRRGGAGALPRFRIFRDQSCSQRASPARTRAGGQALRWGADESPALSIPSGHRVPVRPGPQGARSSTSPAAICCARTRPGSAAATSSRRSAARAPSACCCSATPTRPATGSATRSAMRSVLERGSPDVEVFNFGLPGLRHRSAVPDLARDARASSTTWS